MPGPLIRPYSHYSLTLVTGRNRPEVTRTRAPSPMRSEARVRVASPVTSMCKHGMESADPPCSRPPSPPLGGGERPSPGVQPPRGRCSVSPRVACCRLALPAPGLPSLLSAGGGRRRGAQPPDVSPSVAWGGLQPSCATAVSGEGASRGGRHAPGGPARARAPSRPVGRWGSALTTSCRRRPPRRRPRRRSSTTRPRWPAPRARTSSWPRSSASPRWPRRAPRG